MSGLPPGQKRCLVAIEEFFASNGYAPSIPELADMLKVSNSMIIAHLAKLEKKGYIYRKPCTIRAIKVIKRSTAE